MRSFIRWPLFVALLLVPAALVACGGDDDDVTATQPPASATGAASSPSAAPAFPVTVKDLLGRDVTIKAQPKAIVAISPTAVEFVYAAGGTVVGRASSANYPPESQSAKAVGTAYEPSAEAILALKPDLIVADSVIHSQQPLRKNIEDLGVPVIFAGADSYQKVLDGLLLVGKAIGNEAKAKEASSAITKARDDAKTAVAATKASAVVLIAGRDQTLYAAKSTSFAGDVLTQVGLTNPAASGPESGPGFPGYTTLAPETLVQQNPDLIFTVTPGPANIPRLCGTIAQIPPFKGLKAVTGNKVVELNVDQFVQAPGPRIADAFKAVADAATGKTATPCPKAAG